MERKPLTFSCQHRGAEYETTIPPCHTTDRELVMFLLQLIPDPERHSLYSISRGKTSEVSEEFQRKLDFFEDATGIKVQIDEDLVLDSQELFHPTDPRAIRYS